MSLHKYLAAFEAQAPWGVFSWRDSETAAKGWVVIHSLRGGAAGGGMRMRKGLTCAELLSLSKIMEIKFKVTGPAMGGAKSGIDFDPHDPRKAEVLGRWFKAVKPFLSHYYGTAGDLNISESTEVRPMMAAEGLLHPQIGILRGHYKDEGTKTRLEALRYGTSLLLTHPQLWVSGKESMSDMITGYGVAMSVRHFYDLWGRGFRGKDSGKAGIDTRVGKCFFFGGALSCQSGCANRRGDGCAWRYYCATRNGRKRGRRLVFTQKR